ncbi:MAG: SRPBCC domain-containing protein, partial [Acidobacteria bacterium]|nr:SRPBCC domain-containing protein [Acidobacteriota bacterium]
EVERPARLVYTWAWRGSPMDPAETLVTVDFLERGRETELVLVHERFPSQGDRDQHEHGWSKVLGNLNRFLGTAAQPS